MTLLIVTTTGSCNLTCRYCGGSFDPALVPHRELYDLKEAVELIKRLNADVAFYGGEPLINTDLVMRVMDELQGDGRRFIIQTNGTLVHRLSPKYWTRFDAILLSIDGRREINDLYRGNGNYDRVVRAASWLREIGFGGDLIARMVVHRDSHLYDEVTHLLNLGLFDHVHWQLDAIWSERWPLMKWALEKYLPDIRRLVDLWIERMREGVVLGIAPFLGIMKVELTGEWRSPPCGAGSETFTLLPDGRIVACPIAVQEGWAEVGNVREGIVRRVFVGEPCTSCAYFRYCGGRCLYAYLERYWGDDGFEEVCEVTKMTIDEVLRVAGEVKGLVERGIVQLEDLLYPKYDNTTEIIP